MVYLFARCQMGIMILTITAVKELGVLYECKNRYVISKLKALQEYQHLSQDNRLASVNKLRWVAQLILKRC